MTAPTTRQPAPTDSTGALAFEEVTPAYYYPQITMEATVLHRGRAITVHATDMNADQFCDLLDKRFGPPSANPTPQAAAQAPAGAPPTCLYHGPMKESDKRPGTYYCPKKLADGSYCKEKG